jgi:hypothetical protein
MEKYTFKITNSSFSERKIVLFGGKQRHFYDSTVFEGDLSIECAPKPYQEILKDFSFYGIVKAIKADLTIVGEICTEDGLRSENTAQRLFVIDKGVEYENETGLFAIDPYTIYWFRLPPETTVTITIEAEIKHAVKSIEDFTGSKLPPAVI